MHWKHYTREEPDKNNTRPNAYSTVADSTNRRRPATYKRDTV